MHPTTPFVWIRTTAVCLILAPLLQVVAAVISLPPSGMATGQLDALAAHEDALAISTLIGFAATILYLPAFVGLAHNVARQSPVLSLVAAFFSICSMVGSVGLNALFEGFRIGLAQSAEPSGGAGPLTDPGNPITTTILLLAQGGLVLGLITLVIAVWRSGRFPKVPLILVLAQLVLGVLAQLALVRAPLGSDLGIRLVPVATSLVFFVGLGWLGLVLWRQARQVADQPERIEANVQSESPTR